MRAAIRRFGPVLFWQYTWFLVVILPLGLAAQWIARGGSLWEWYCALGMVTTAAFGLLMSESSRSFLAGEYSGRLRVPRPLRIPDDFRTMFALSSFLSTVAIVQSLNDGFTKMSIASALLGLAIIWQALTVLFWVVWACGGLRFEAETPWLRPRTDPAPGRTRSRLTDSTGDAITVTVDPADPLTLAEALKDVLVAQYLPAVSGGAREWTALVDGAAVGVVVQSWEHPKFWRPIRWSADPNAPFEGREVSFRPKPPPTTLHDRIVAGGFAYRPDGQDRQ